MDAPSKKILIHTLRPHLSKEGYNAFTRGYTCNYQLQAINKISMSLFPKRGSIRGSSRGFTLIELLVVVAIIGILSSIVLASLNSARKKGRDARRISDIKQLQLALELYYDSTGGYPVGTALAPVTPTYISVVPADPTNTGIYVYSYQATNGAATPAACASGTCAGYVLKAVLETDHSALDGDVDGTQVGITCADSATDFFYCAMP